MTLMNAKANGLTEARIIEIAVAHSNYREGEAFEVFSHERIVEFARVIANEAAAEAIETRNRRAALSQPAGPSDHAGVETILRDFHRNSCYPDAMDFEHFREFADELSALTHPSSRDDVLEAAERDTIERCAKAIECDCCDVCGESPAYENVCANELAARIRALSGQTEKQGGEADG